MTLVIVALYCIYFICVCSSPYSYEYCPFGGPCQFGFRVLLQNSFQFSVLLLNRQRHGLVSQVHGVAVGPLHMREALTRYQIGRVLSKNNLIDEGISVKPHLIRRRTIYGVGPRQWRWGHGSVGEI